MSININHIHNRIGLSLESIQESAALTVTKALRSMGVSREEKTKALYELPPKREGDADV